MKICPLAHFAKVGSKFGQILNKTSRNCQRFFQNFAKSGNNGKAAACDTNLITSKSNIRV